MGQRDTKKQEEAVVIETDAVLIQKVPCFVFCKTKFIVLSPKDSADEMKKARAQDVSSISTIETKIVTDDSGQHFINVDAIRNFMGIDVEIRIKTK